MSPRCMSVDGVCVRCAPVGVGGESEAEGALSRSQGSQALQSRDSSDQCVLRPVVPS